MISRRNFFSMIIMMAVLLFMFQVPEVVKESQSDHGVNIYIEEEALSGADAWEQESGTYEDGDFVVYFGKEDSDVGSVVRQWCIYTKRNLTVYGSFFDYQLTPDRLPEAVLVDSDIVDLAEGLNSFREITEYGVTLIFCNLPEPAKLRGNRELLELLGIQGIRQDSIETEGVRLFGDFLLGGESLYIVGDGDEKEQERQDFELNVPWYIMRSGTKTYMVAVLDELLADEEAKNELFPALIWRNAYQGARVFVVNGDYLEYVEGIGILSGIIYEASSYSLYPVVNAQNVTVADFPGFAGENDDRIMELYSRGTEGVLRDVCWPAISGIAERNHYKLTCLLATQFDYTDEKEPSVSLIPFYLQQFREYGSEAGISLTHWDITDFSEKTRRDEGFFAALEDPYIYSALYVQKEDLAQLENELNVREFLKNVRTLTCEYQEKKSVVSYYNEDVTWQNVTSNAEFHSYSDDFRVKSLETALGYSNVLLDMYPVMWPETEDDQWEKVVEEIASNLDTYWKPFAVFAKTTMSESDARVRNFLNLDYRETREGDTIYLDLSGVDSGWFILRTHGEQITEIGGGTYEVIEEDAYLIFAQQAHVELRMERSRGNLKYSVDRGETVSVPIWRLL